MALQTTLTPATKPEFDPLKVRHLVLTNIQGIHHISIVADPLINEMVGKNRVGKTSVLRGLIYGFTGERNIPQEPIRIGEEEGEVWLDTDQFVLSRRFSKDLESGVTKTILNVKLDDDGTKVGQTYINGLLGRLTFNPQEFMHLSGPEQADIVKTMAGDEFVEQLREFSIKEEAAYENRKVLKRILKDLGQPSRVPEISRISATDLLQQRNKIEEFNSEQDRRQRDHDAHDDGIKAQKIQVQDLREQLEKAKHILSGVEKSKAELKPVEKRNDPTEIDKQIASIDGVNEQADAYDTYLKNKAKVRESQVDVDEAEKEIKTIRRDRDKAIKAAKIPIEGLSFTDSGIRIDGKPIEQLSGQEQLHLSVRIGMTLNPTLAIMLIPNGEQLDEEGMQQLINLAMKYKRQLWIATVGDGHQAVRDRGLQLIIEDGAIKK